MRTYTYRRDLQASDWMKAIGFGAGAGIGAALVVTYMARVFLQRTPLADPIGAPTDRSDRRGLRP